MLRLVEWGVENYGPFVGRHVVRPPRSGVVLVRGDVEGSGDGSGAGKSHLLSALPFLFGGCPYPATELQSWYSEEPPRAWAVLDRDGEEIRVERFRGLTVKVPGATVKGRAAEEALTRLFGMDADVRALATYRGQEQRGVFMSMGDGEKKDFLRKLLPLGVVESVVNAATARVAELTPVVEDLKSRASAAQLALSRAIQDLESCPSLIDLAPLQAHLDALQSELTKNQEEAAGVRATIASLKTSIGESASRRIQELNQRLGAVPGDSQAIPLAQRSELNARLAEAHAQDRLRRAEAEQLDSAIKRQLEIVAEIDRRLAEAEVEVCSLRAARCPRCAQPWHDGDLPKVEARIEKLKVERSQRVTSIPKPSERWTADPKIEELQTGLRELETTIKTAQLMATQAKAAAVAGIQAEIQRIKEQAVVELAERSAQLLDTLKHIDAKAVYYHENLSVNRDDLRDAEAGNIRVAERARLCARLKLEAAEVEGKLATFLAELNLEQDVERALGRTGFLGVIFDDILAEISATANNIFAAVQNVQHVTFGFEVEKESSKGTMTRRISPVVGINGESKPWGSAISGGMKTSIRFGVDLAVGLVGAAQASNFPGWLIQDEALDGLGPRSKEACLEMLRKYAGDRLVLVVDHDTRFQALFDASIEVTQRDGRSSLTGVV